MIRSRLGRFARCALLVGATAAPVNAAPITIDMVTVGNPGNAPDLRYNLDQRPEGFGAVNHVYQIGKYEVTAGQYTAFLNAVAADDTYGLYNEFMDYDAHPDPDEGLFGCNIKRSGSPGSYAYSVAADWGNRPVNWVSFWGAARFANWLHNGQPNGMQVPGTTEDGAYHNVGEDLLFGRNAGARFFIPSEDEWYKAAYHDKSAGLAAKYFDYPTGTNAMPGRDVTETTNSGNNANYGLIGGRYLIGGPYYRTEVGEFELSDSAYGTFDQGGNVGEWNEMTPDVSMRGLRGWSFESDDLGSSGGLHAHRGYGSTSVSSQPSFGFRVAGVPEPSTLVLFALAATGLLIVRRAGRHRLSLLVAVALLLLNATGAAHADIFRWDRPLGLGSRAESPHQNIPTNDLEF